MTDPTKPGLQTTEWTVFKYVAMGCAALAAGLTVVVSSGAITDPVTLSILGGVVAMLGFIGGGTGKEYIKRRGLLKQIQVAANAAAREQSAEATSPANPTK